MVGFWIPIDVTISIGMHRVRIAYLKLTAGLRN
jgi:hypothetical protein